MSTVRRSYEELERDVKIGYACHGRAVERYDALGMGIMQAIADGKPKRVILELIGESFDACDHIDDESLALFKRATAALDE